MEKFRFFLFFFFFSINFCQCNSLLIPKVFENVFIEDKIGNTLPNIKILNKEGIYQFYDFFSNTPIILILIYYKCNMLCNVSLLNLHDSIKKNNLQIGKDYKVITLGFDSSEDINLIDLKKKYLNIENDEINKNWNFFIISSKEDSNKLTNSLGFKYKYDFKTKEYSHAAGIFIISSNYKLVSILWGTNYNKTDIEISIQNAFLNKNTIFNSVLLNCFHYISDFSKYGNYIFYFIRISILFIIVVFYICLLKYFQKKKLKK